MKNENATPTIKHDGQLSIPHGGLTLRDYFAAKAMHGFLIIEKDEDGTSLMDLAELSYLAADAMLGERNK